jgi:hypothetical protein
VALTQSQNKEVTMIDKSELFSYADGQWENILSSLLHADISDALSSVNKSTHYQCPFPEKHGNSGGKKKFRFRYKNGALNAICSCGSWDKVSLLMDVNNWSFPEVLKEVNNFLGEPVEDSFSKKHGWKKGNQRNSVVIKKQTMSSGDQNTKGIIQPKSVQSKPISQPSKVNKNTENTISDSDQKKKKNIQKYWSESCPAKDSELARRYLQSRGINPEVLNNVVGVHFHPSMEYWEVDDNDKPVLFGHFPAILILFKTKEEKAGTFHRIYLDEEGNKLNRPGSSKKLMPRPEYVEISGGAMQIMEPEYILNVAEGFETAMAVNDALDSPVWSCYNTTMLSYLSIELLKKKNVHFVAIWVDKDLSLAGEAAAKTLKKRCEDAGIICQLMIPDAPISEGKSGIDWCDVLKTYGPGAFPMPIYQP